MAFSGQAKNPLALCQASKQMVNLSVEDKGVADAVLDALTSQICVLDQTGTISLVNESWRRFALENSRGPTRTGIGTNYLDVCRAAVGPGSEGASKFAAGADEVLEGRSKLFQMEYPCHSPTEDRWFLARVTPLRTRDSGAVVSHANITDRKKAELELAKLASTDPLTGLPNRRLFMDVANRELERLQRFCVPSAIVMLDLDHFKSINDTHGHAAGDVVLKRCAQMLKRGVRKIDVIARFGGEELAILFPGTTEAAVRVVAEKLRDLLSRTPIPFEGNALNVTASFGVTEVLPDDTGIDEALRRADKSLYAAKHLGRNCVVTSSSLEL